MLCIFHNKQKPILKEFIKEQNNITFVCLDGVTDARNIGALIRSAVSFDIDGLIIKERNFPSESKLSIKLQVDQWSI